VKRTAFKPRQQTLSQRAKLKVFKKSGKKSAAGNVSNPLKKNTGRRLVPKDDGPIYSEAHLKLVREQPCIVSGVEGCVAHHIRGLLPRTMGVRVTDFLTVSLRPDLHDGYGHSLHRHGNEAEWWSYSGLPKAKVFEWLRKFLRAHYPRSHPGVVQAFAKMAAEEEREAT